MLAVLDASRNGMGAVDLGYQLPSRVPEVFVFEVLCAAVVFRPKTGLFRRLATATLTAQLIWL